MFKFFKKPLTCLLALAIVFLSLPLAYANSEALVHLEAVRGPKCDELMLNVYFENAEGLGAAMFEINFDSDALEYLELQNAYNSDMFNGGMSDYEDNTLTAAFMYYDSLDTQAKTLIVTYYFKIKSIEKAENLFDFEVQAWAGVDFPDNNTSIDLDGQNFEHSFSEWEIKDELIVCTCSICGQKESKHIEEEGLVHLEAIREPGSDEFTLDIYVENSKGLEAANFEIPYKSDVVEFIGLEKGQSADMLEGGISLYNENVLTCGIVYMNILETNDKTLIAKYNFKIKPTDEIGDVFGFKVSLWAKDRNEYYNFPIYTITEDLEEHKHSFSNWIVETPATTESKGKEYRECSCGKKEYRSIPKLIEEKIKFVQSEDFKVVSSEEIPQALILYSSMTMAEMLALIENENIVIRDKQGKVIAAGDAFGSGDTINLSPDGKLSIDSYTIVLLGDTNGDGKITAFDARFALRTSARLEENISAWQFLSSNVIADEKITAQDARKILRVSAKLENFDAFSTLQ